MNLRKSLFTIASLKYQVDVKVLQETIILKRIGRNVQEIYLG